MADDHKKEEERGSIEGGGAARAPDAYEAQYMGGQDVLYRAKIKVPKTFFLLFLLPILIQVVTFTAVGLQGKAVSPGIFLIPVLTTTLLSLIALLFSVLRITVTRSEVLVQYGLFGPRIPTGSIQDCKVVSYNWMDYGGWGIRRGRDGSWAYNMMGDAGRAVRIEWLDGGKKQVTLLASPDPSALARAVNEARGAAAPPGLRVPAEPDAAELEAEAEAEAEAAVEEEKGRRR